MREYFEPLIERFLAGLYQGTASAVPIDGQSIWALAPVFIRSSMRGIFASLLLLAPWAAQAAPMDTIRIIITGGNLTAPIEIADPAVARIFKVWAGPGNFKLAAGVEVPIIFGQGFIIDWSQGAVEPPPKAATVYQVSFVTTRPDHNIYVVRYIIDPSTNHGYVYLPGKGEAAYPDNTWMIYRGVEGKWFHA